VTELFIAEFGPLVHPSDVNRQLIKFFQKWLPTYYSAAERRANKPVSWLARPAFYATIYDEDDEDFLSDRRMPTVFVSNIGFAAWERTGDGLYSATAILRVSYVCRGRNAPEAQLQASLGIATITELMLGKPALGGFAGHVDPVEERVRPVRDPSNRSRHLMGGMGEYAVFCPGIRAALPGPFDPEPPTDPTTPPTDLPDVTEVLTDVEGYTPAMDLEG
jgi:hypothetical protein